MKDLATSTYLINTPLPLTGNRVYDGKIRNFNGWLQARGKETLTFEDVQEFFRSLKSRELKPATLLSYRAALKKSFLLSMPEGSRRLTFRMLLSEALRDLKLTRPTRQVNPTIDCLSEAEIKKLIQVAEESGYRKLSLLIRYLYLTGSRIQEALDARLANTANIENKVIVRYTTTKTRQECRKTIPITLFDSIKEEFAGSVFLFENPVGKPYTARNFNYQLRKIGKNTLHRSISSHIFRRSSASTLLSKYKADIHQIRMHLNHSDVRTTLTAYAFSNTDNHHLEHLYRGIVTRPEIHQC